MPFRRVGMRQAACEFQPDLDCDLVEQFREWWVVEFREQALHCDRVVRKLVDPMLGLLSRRTPRQASFRQIEGQSAHVGGGIAPMRSNASHQSQPRRRLAVR